MVQIQIYPGAGHGNNIPEMLVCVGMSDSIEMQEYDKGTSKQVEVKRSKKSMDSAWNSRLKSVE